MRLLDLWRSNPDVIKAYAVRQIVAFAGDGRMRDHSACSDEFRAYLQETTSDKLASYAVECLEESFEDSGFVLQDVVNEIGRRLEFDVENGRYRGKSGAVGYDGIWRVGSDLAIIVEVKTTDAYNVRLEEVAGYRAALTSSHLTPATASTLFVVGRMDTGALEAQIRGSRHAWDMRVVGVDSLVKLMRVKEKSNEDTTIRQIRELLRPFEYTRIDRIVDVVFDTAIDVEQSIETEVVEETSAPERVSSSVAQLQERTEVKALDEMRERIVASLQRHLGVGLVRRRRALYESIDGRKRACIAVSKRYDRVYQPYWYAYHPAWNEFLKGAEDGRFVLGCMDREDAFAIPFQVMVAFLPKLNQTERQNGERYWHIVVTTREDGTLALYSSKTRESIDLQQFSIRLDATR